MHVKKVWRKKVNFKKIMAENQELPDFGLKCKKCRSGFLAESQLQNDFKSTSDLYVFSEENMPNWIQLKVEEVSFQRICAYAH